MHFQTKKDNGFFVLDILLSADQMEAMVRQYVVWCLSVTAQYISIKEGQADKEWKIIV